MTRPTEAAREILVRGAEALARGDRLQPTLEIVLGLVAAELDIESAVIVIVHGRADDLAIAAAYGLGEAVVAGLAEAIKNPGHPIVRTVTQPVSSFDVTPTAPGGPALRSHLPLIVTRDGTTTVLGVLALAHHHPIAPANRSLLGAAADLAAVAVDLYRDEAGPGETPRA